MRIQPVFSVRGFLVSLSVAGLIAGCGGGSGNGGGNNAPPPPPPPPFAANFSAIQSNVFTPTCATAGCHIGAGAPQGLRLDDANSYGLLVGVASSENAALMRVNPGNPDISYLIQKLEGTASVGERMPFGGQALDQTVIAVIRQWITDGAIDDRAPSAAPIRVTSLSPVPGADLATPPAEIIAMFDRQLDASTINTNTFVLEASGGDGTFADGNEMQINAAAITAPAVNPMSATFDLTGVALADETYRVRLLGSGASMILDIDANALDGEFSGTFPSGNGTQGGDFEAVFTVTTPVVGSPTLDDIQASVFTPRCSNSGCHSGGGAVLPTVMDLTSADASFANLVGVSSLEVPALSRVAAGDADNSYLIQKLEGTAAVGVRMPPIGPALNQTVIDDIRQWIDDGAAR